ncbi:MAG TPA: hypothetical protein GXZ45_14820 [Propionibacterium sp.]|nr:hypothetical protein [Propionibacterium sp.]
MARRDDSPRGNPGAVALGILWLLGGALLAGSGLLRLVPTLYALGAIALVAGAIGLVVAFLPNTTVSFWAELVPSGLLVALGAVLVRFPTLEPRALAVAASVVFLGSGTVRLGAAREFVAAWRPFLVAGLVSVFLGLVLLSDVLEPTTTGVAFLLGCDLIVGGAVLMQTSRR